MGLLMDIERRQDGTARVDVEGFHRQTVALLTDKTPVADNVPIDNHFQYVVAFAPS